MRTDLTKLMDLCSTAHYARQSARAAAEAESEKAAREDAVTFASKFAAQVLGSDAAAALGPWTPLEEMAGDCLQASARLTPHAFLLYTDHCEDGPRLELVASCPRCRHDRLQEVRDLAELHAALVAAGVR